MPASDQLKMPWARWTATEVAKEIGVSTSTVRRRLIARGLMDASTAIPKFAIDAVMVDAIRERSSRKSAA